MSCILACARLSHITRGGLANYARRRNAATQPDGVSRMSAYLNLGMVSLMRLTRDALTCGGDGREKFMSEFHVWRELAYAHCFHNPGTHRTVAGLPQWAQATLRAHEGDPRKVVHMERLVAAQSGHAVWDAMQECLLARGELHNNASMTWGKQILGWSATVAEAAERLLYLNDHFALDGQSPPSVGGLFWCLGLFDSPKGPERPVSGVLRAKPLGSYKHSAAQFRAALGLGAAGASGTGQGAGA